MKYSTDKPCCFISGFTKDYVQINIPTERAQAMLNKDEKALSEFAGLIDKFVTWLEDIKLINTKAILNIDYLAKQREKEEEQ
jgi:hypothetical protein